MSLERFVSCLACLLLALGGAATARAKTYSLTGGGGQLAIGDGLPLPIQVFPTSATGTVFPPLLVPANTAKIIQGTTAMSVQQRLTIPAGVLSRPAQQRTLGLFAQNPTLYAVATNLGWQWPAAPAVLSTGARTGNKTTTFLAAGGTIRYSNALASKFGGPARFAIADGPPAGLIPGAPMTAYAIAVRPTGNPPCTHPELIPPLGGTFSNPACVAALGALWPHSVIGGPVSTFASSYSPPGPPVPGIGLGKFGQTPIGTVSFFTYTPNGTRAGFTNAASSFGFPWTTGMLTISHPCGQICDFFTITGMDDRTPGGAGTIQLVAGGLSNRLLSGPNANRGWVRLQLQPRPDAVPAMSPAGLAATAGLMLLVVVYALRRRLSAQAGGAQPDRARSL